VVGSKEISDVVVTARDRGGVMGAEIGGLISIGNMETTCIAGCRVG
jgi:hypothetical protein